MGGITMRIKPSNIEVNDVLETLSRIERINGYQEEKEMKAKPAVKDMDKDLYFQQHTFNH
jgi:hypothetical protein